MVGEKIYHHQADHVLTLPRNFIFGQKYTNRDVGKYARLTPPGAHRGPEKHLLDDNEDYFGGLQNRFSRHMHRFLGDEEEAPRGPHRESEGAHIQLTRRYLPANVLEEDYLGGELSDIWLM